MKHKNLPNNLTYEQFKALAEQEPDMNADCVYELTCYEIDDPEKPLYPKFSIYRVSSTFMFRAKEETEAYMHGIVSGNKKEQINISKETIYCFYINRVLLDGSASMHDLTWLYDSTGMLLDWQYLPRNGEHVGDDRHYYFGRPKERIRFHKGDIVEVSMYDEVHLAVVVSEEPDIDWCWRLYGRCMANKRFPYYSCDDTDFSATVVTGPDYGWHEHVSPLNMMKPRFPILGDLREYFRKCCFEPEDDDEPESPEDNESPEPSGQHPNMDFDVDLEEFYGLRLYIHHDADTEFPHFHICGFDNSLLVSLRLDRPEYYPHEGCFNDTLTDRQKELIMEDLTEVEYGRTRWWYMLRKWNGWHKDKPELQLLLDMPLPDYTKLP